MGHDEHFLSRLDRVEFSQVEFALSLYNDAPLVRFILQAAKIPDRVERVAISLAHPVRGPFLVVARDGGFVTCLGEGMSPGPHPIITRTQLDAFAERAAVIRERIEHARTMVGRLGHAGKLLARLYDAGEFMGREEMLALALWQPVLWPAMFELFSSCRDAALTLMERAVHVERPGRGADETLKAYWHAVWGSAHLLTLLVMDGASAIPAAVREVWNDEADMLTLLNPLVCTGSMGFGLRAAWISARLHKHIVPLHKKRLRESVYAWEVRDSVLALTACAGAHARSRAEIVKVLDVGDPGDVVPGMDALRVMTKLRWVLGTFANFSINRDEAGQWESVRTVGRPFARQMTQDFPMDHTYRFERVEDVPDDLAATALFETRWTLQDEMWDHTRIALEVIPALARLPMEQLYLPRAFNAGFPRKWDPRCAIDLLEPRRQALRFRHREPLRVAPTPGRNDPCSCGSGKKYKKCCGA